MKNCKSMLKYILPSILGISLTLSTYSTALAYNSNNNTTNNVINSEKPTKVTKINEYEFMNKLKNKSDSQLKQQGFSDLQVKEIRNTDIKAKVYELSKMSKDEIKKQGFSDNQTEKIKNFKGTDAELAAMAASCTIYSNLNSYNYSSRDNRTYASVGFSFGWNARPIIDFTDIIGVCWSEGFYFSGGSASLHYEYSLDTSLTYNTSVNFTQVGLGNSACSLKVPVNPSGYYYLNSGSGSVSISKSGKVNEFSMLFDYGHNQINATPEIKLVNLTPQIEIKFGSGINSEDTSVHHYTLK